MSALYDRCSLVSRETVRVVVQQFCEAQCCMGRKRIPRTLQVLNPGCGVEGQFSPFRVNEREVNRHDDPLVCSEVSVNGVNLDFL